MPPKNSYVLHMALKSSLNVSVAELKLLIRDHPESLTTHGNDGYLPIHIAMEDGHGIFIVRTLVEACPESLLIPNVKGFLPIHVGCKSLVSNNESIIHIATQSIESLAVKSKKGMLPLHYACQNTEKANIIPSLIDLYPESISIRNSEGSLPIHVACKYTSSDVILHLATTFPESVRLKDEKGGKLPVHISCQHKSFDSGVVQALIDLYPESIHETTSRGCLPIHMACGNSDPKNDSLILYLINKYPESVRFKDEDFYLPVHYACQYRFTASIVPILVEFYPESVKMRTKRENLPIHIASAHGTSDVTVYLSKRYPESLKIQDEHGYLPIHYICQDTNGAEIIPTLVDMYPDSLMIKTKKGDLPIHLLSKRALMSDSIETSFLYMATIRPLSLTTIGSQGQLALPSLFLVMGERMCDMPCGSPLLGVYRSTQSPTKNKSKPPHPNYKETHVA